MGSRNQCWSHNATMAWTSIKPALLQLESLLLASSSSENFATTATSSFPWEGRSASAECPPQTGFNAFAFLAFILIAIDTIMNINNNINNNNNNNNNNDRNNNNNNNFEAMNMNVRRSFQEDGSCKEVLAGKLLLSNGTSPWSPEVWNTVAGPNRGLVVMRRWMEALALSHPVCLVVLPCLAAVDLVHPSIGRFCPPRLSCPLFTG